MENNFLRKLIREQILSESESNLTLWHGSSTMKPIDRFFDNQFYTVNQDLAASYAFNNGGLLYKVAVGSLKPFVIEEKAENMERTGSGARIVGTDEEMAQFLKELYGKDTYDLFQRIGFAYGLGRLVQGDAMPLVAYAEKLGYDSLRFWDESFDTFLHDTSYVIFDGSKPKIDEIVNVDMTDYEFIYSSFKNK